MCCTTFNLMKYSALLELVDCAKVTSYLLWNLWLWFLCGIWLSSVKCLDWVHKMFCFEILHFVFFEDWVGIYYITSKTLTSLEFMVTNNHFVAGNMVTMNLTISFIYWVNSNVAIIKWVKAYAIWILLFGPLRQRV